MAKSLKDFGFNDEQITAITANQQALDEVFKDARTSSTHDAGARMVTAEDYGAFEVRPELYTLLPEGSDDIMIQNNAADYGWITVEESNKPEQHEQLVLEYDQICEDFDNLIDKYEVQTDSIAFLQEKLDQHDKEFCELEEELEDERSLRLNREEELEDERSLRLNLEETLYDIYHALQIPSGDEDLVVAYAKHYRQSAGRDEFESPRDVVENPQLAYERAMKAIVK